MSPLELIVDIERMWADDAGQLAGAIADLDNSWGTEVFAVGDGLAVLCGPGLYVNRVLALGLTLDPSEDDLETIEARSHEVGVAPSVEVCDATRPALKEMLRRRDYVDDGRTTALIHDLGHVLEPDPSVSMHNCGMDDIGIWQEAAAAGWGHTTAVRRAPSDTFAAAAARVDKPGLMVARSTDDGRILGCATLKIGSGIATLGGMSTLPVERRKGVQAALVHHRLRLAQEAGCQFAASSARQGGASERNLVSLGFHVSHTKTEFIRFLTPKAD